MLGKRPITRKKRLEQETRMTDAIEAEARTKTKLLEKRPITRQKRLEVATRITDVNEAEDYVRNVHVMYTIHNIKYTM